MQTWKMTKQQGDFVHAVFSWWFSLEAKSLLLSRLFYTETIVQKSGVCSAICSLLLRSTGQLLNPIKYLPFSTKHYSMWLLSQLKMLWKEKRESYIMWKKQFCCFLSLMSLNLSHTIKWCTEQCPVASQALQGVEGQVPSLSLFLHRVYGILVSAIQK